MKLEFKIIKVGVYTKIYMDVYCYPIPKNRTYFNYWINSERIICTGPPFYMKTVQRRLGIEILL